MTVGNLPRIVAIAGRLHSGKSTAARLLSARLGYLRTVHINVPMVDMARQLLIHLGITDADEQTSILQGDRKNEVIGNVCGRDVSGRLFLRALGKDFRDAIHEDLYIDLWWRRYRDAVNTHPVINESVRFPNEARFLRDNGAVVLRIRTASDNDYAPGEAYYEPDIAGDVEIVNHFDGEEVFGDKLVDLFERNGWKK